MDLIRLELPEGDQMDFQIALVDEPAIESDWVAFSKDSLKRQDFKVHSKERKIISGYAMIADMKIPRYDQERGAYNVVFDKQGIEKIVYNFFKNGLTTNTNEMHQTNQFAPGVYVFESFIIDSERGVKAPEGFKTEADGSWFISMKVENDDIWQRVLKGDYNGFSIECRFKEYQMSKDDKFLNELEEILTQL